MLSCLSRKRWTDSLRGVGLAGVPPPEASALVSPCDLRDSESSGRRPALILTLFYCLR